MNNKSRLSLVALVVVVVAFLGGLFLGRSGRSEVEAARNQAELLLDLQTGRARLLDARVAIYNVNFGEASRHIERAKGVLVRGRDTLNASNRTADAGHIDRVLVAIDEAQRMVGALDQSANTKLAEALDAFKELSLPDMAPSDGQ